MHKTFAALGLAVAVPVALAAPALAKSPDTKAPTQFVSSVLLQHEGFRAEVTYLCTGPKHQEGTITVSLRQPAKPGASDFTTVASAQEEAKCDGKVREEKIKIPLGAEPVRADQKLWLYTTLKVNDVLVDDHITDAEPVVDDSAPTPGPTVTTSTDPEPEPVRHGDGGPADRDAEPDPVRDADGGPADRDAEPQPVRHEDGGPADPDPDGVPQPQRHLVGRGPLEQDARSGSSVPCGTKRGSGRERDRHPSVTSVRDTCRRAGIPAAPRPGSCTLSRRIERR